MLILGMEFGSTRIKSVLTDENSKVICTGSYGWENKLVGGLWSYDMEEAIRGMQVSYADMAANYFTLTGRKITKLDAIGISSMQHGYLAFDKDGNQLVPFRTWRNTNAEEAGKELTEAFGFHLPMRWSVAEYYQAILDGEEHVGRVARLYTLSSYIHFNLTGRHVSGICEASGIFPMDGKDYDRRMLALFDEKLKKHGIGYSFRSLLPEVLVAGENAGYLTPEGALLIDPSGTLQSGCPMCPPEGDMGTGCVATNSVKPGNANFVVGTSVNLCVALSKPLSRYYDEIDILSAPDAGTLAMVHVNNGTSELDTWLGLFREVLNLFDLNPSVSDLYTRIYNKSLESDMNAGGISSYNFLAAEPIAGAYTGALSVMRGPEGKMSLANFMQSQIYGSIASISYGMGILQNEGVRIDNVYGHGGFFKTPFIGQNAASAVLNAPVTVTEAAGEGGAWGIAVLALYMLKGTKKFTDFLDDIFDKEEKNTVIATEKEKEKFAAYFENYTRCLEAQKILGDIADSRNH